MTEDPRNLFPLKQTLPQPQGVAMRIEQSSFIGPLPPPDVLAKYEAISPGFADRIIKMAEAEGEHRRSQEKQSLAADITAREIALKTDQKTIADGFRIQRRGQLFAFLIGIFTIGAGVYAAIEGANIVGGLIGTTGVVGLVSVFIWGREKPPSNPPSKPSENT